MLFYKFEGKTSKQKYLLSLSKIKSFLFMTINDAQQEVDNWIKTVGIRYFSELTNMAILTEEVGELARIIARKYGDQSFKNNEDQADLGDEMADVLWVLICLANQTGVNLTDAFQKNMEKKSKRDTDRHKNNEKLKG
jgi:NTP pyrophosphatase (non-canonical NTP hydrolase)